MYRRREIGTGEGEGLTDVAWVVELRDGTVGIARVVDGEFGGEGGASPVRDDQGDGGAEEVLGCWWGRRGGEIDGEVCHGGDGGIGWVV